MKFGRWLLTGTLLMLPAQMFAQGRPNPAELEAERAALFTQADADGSGTLSLDEFKTFESLVRDTMTEHHFAHVDANGDGAVSLDELQADHPGPPPFRGHPPF